MQQKDALHDKCCLAPHFLMSGKLPRVLGTLVTFHQGRQALLPKMEDKAQPDPGSQRGMEPALASHQLSCLVDIALANAAEARILGKINHS